MSAPHDPPRPVPPRPLAARRDFLRLAVLAPVAIAGCATSGSSARPDRGAPPKTAAKAGSPDEAPAAMDALRAVPLAMDVEPAFVFRAGRRE
jgi:hypothetical protein